jgi:hypothetical protein
VLSKHYVNVDGLQEKIQQCRYDMDSIIHQFENLTEECVDDLKRCTFVKISNSFKDFFEGLKLAKRDY